MATTKRNTCVNYCSSFYSATTSTLGTLKVCIHLVSLNEFKSIINSAVNLLSSNKYTEKQIGYLFISVLLNDGNDLVNLIIQNIKNDLSSRNPIHVNLALHCIANVGTREMAEVRLIVKYTRNNNLGVFQRNSQIIDFQRRYRPSKAIGGFVYVAALPRCA